jgi:hypothetical protein
MFPVFYAFRVLWAGILHWGQRPAVVNAVPNLEKTIRITENQQQGTTHRHDFTVNSAAAANCCHQGNNQDMTKLYMVLKYIYFIQYLEF